MKHRRWGTIGVGIAAIVGAALIAPGTAAAEEPTDPAEVRLKVSAEEVVDFAEDGMSAEMTDVISKIDLEGAFDGLNRFVWDAENRRLLVHVNQRDAELEEALSAQLPESSFTLVEDEFDLAVLTAEADRIARLGTIGGVTISYAGANADSSGIEVGFVPETNARSAEAAESRIRDELNTPYPIDLVPSEQIETTNRLAQTSLPTWGGALMNNGAANCSTGFWAYSPGVPYSQITMLTAAHCSGTGSTWKIGSTTVGVSASANAGGADILRLNGASSAIGVLFYGPYYSNVGVAVSGFSSPALGQSWCINGALSGTVCNNTVTLGPVTVNMTDNYGNPVGSYSNSWLSEQQSAVPAAGNGDSGGNVFRVSDGLVYPTGIISGMQNATSSCTGIDGSDTRVC